MTDKTLQIDITNDPTYMENGYTVYLHEGGPCWIIDPGFPPQAGKIVLAHRGDGSLAVPILDLPGGLGSGGRSGVAENA